MSEVRGDQVGDVRTITGRTMGVRREDLAWVVTDVFEHPEHTLLILENADTGQVVECKVMG